MLNFFSEDVDFNLPHPLKTKKWLKSVSLSEGYELKELNYIFCSDNYLLEINKQYLDHDYYTDIITFDNSDEDNQLEGDIYVSLDRVKENASTFHVDFESELRRVLVHGLLHLAGYDDSDDEQKQLMREKENEHLTRF
jgi:rRNA maturation RNase YbeY